MLHKIIITLGHNKTVLFITLISIFISVVLFKIIELFTPDGILLTGIVASILIPMLVAPIASWHLVKLFIKVDTLEQKMRELATVDGLTRVQSRQSLLSDADKLYSKIQDENKTLALFYLDIDDFKKINDGYGHDIGDRVLQSFGKDLLKCTKDRALVGRLGGEEFLIVHPYISTKEALEFANHLQHDLSPVNIESTTIDYTVSIGLAFLDKQNIMLDELMIQADKALYIAKSSGKNCVVEYDI